MNHYNFLQQLSPTRRRPSIRKIGLEYSTLEPRAMLAALPMITEFMAANNSGLADEDGDRSDWIEIYNAGDTAQNLAGWHLTDNVQELQQWTFPSVTLQAGDFLVVFASSKNRADADGTELHTNFKLGASGEYLALTDANANVIHEYAPNFPAQNNDVSYGLAMSSSVTTLADDNTPLTYLVPPNGTLGTSWTQTGFNDASWLGAGATIFTAGIGYETSPADYAALIDTVIPNNTESLYTRFEFTVAQPGDYNSLELGMIFDDGFVAYLNGTKVAVSYNAPANPVWNSTTNGDQRSDQQVIEDYVSFDIRNHLNLLQVGTNVLAIHAINASAGSSDMLMIPRLRAGQASLITPLSIGFFSTPTPGTTNGQSFQGFVKDTQFSVDRGFYNAPFAVAITSATSGALIVYTTNGSDPTTNSALTITNGTAYTGPITISRTTVLRAAAFKIGFEPTNIDTQTYLFAGDVADQSYAYTLAQGFPTSWGSNAPDYGVNLPPGARTAFTAALTAVPTISISLNQADLFSASTGIYTNSSQSGQAWERAASIEYLLPDGSTGFQENAGLRLQGGAFRSFGLSDKHSFRIVFRNQYGAGKLNYDLFGGNATDSFDTITLRMDSNDGWAWGAAGTQPLYARDEFGRRTQLALGQPSPHGNRAHVYINGIYWGLYNPVERPDANFAASYFGGDADNWDANNSGEAIDGNLNSWNTLLSLSQAVANASTESARTTAYLALQGLNANGTNNPNAENYLDVDNYIDYLIVNYYGGNSDWPQKNYYTARERGLNSTGYKFFMWDAEWSLGLRSTINTNRTGDFRGVAAPYGNLRSSAEFRLRFADRVHQALFNNGPLTSTNSIARFQSILAEIDSAINGEAGRWGDMHNAAGYTRADWLNESNIVINSFLTGRTGIFISQLRTAGLYSTVNAVSWNQRGGIVNPGFDLQLSAPQGTIYYTTNGSDPRLTGGAVSPTATAVSGLIDINANVIVKARVLFNGVWSAIDAATFSLSTPSSNQLYLRISEVNYNPSSGSDSEFIEFLNISSGANATTLQLAGVTISDGPNVPFVFATGRTLAAGQRLLVVQDMTAFLAKYPSVSPTLIAGTYEGSLSNKGERIQVNDLGGQLILQLTYGDNDPWSPFADGAGGTLQLINEFSTPLERIDKYYSWRGSNRAGGSPGAAPGSANPAILIHEILAHTDLPQRDFIELFNASSSTVDIGGWFLSDDQNSLNAYQIPMGTMIPAGGFLVFDERNFNPTPLTPAQNHFALSSLGENVWLTRIVGGVTEFIDVAQFGASFNGMSIGRTLGGTGRLHRLAAPTPGSTNAPAKLGPVLITEVNYHPGQPTSADLAIDPTLTENDLEFIEIHNTSSVAINMMNWMIAGEVNFEFPAGSLGAGASWVIVSFDPSTPALSSKLAAFRNHYGIANNPTILGGFAGHLSNNYGLVSLQKPDLPPPGSPNTIPHVTIDEVLYDDLAPWFINADGGGSSLQRINAVGIGSVAAHWTAASVTPGSANLTAVAPRVIASSRDVNGIARPDLIQSVSFSFDVNVSIAKSNISMSNATLGGATVSLSNVNFSYDPSEFVARLDFSNLASPLPAGYYDLTISSNGVFGVNGNLGLDGDGNGTAGGDFTWRIYVAIPGDANLDGDVDVAELDVIAGRNVGDLTIVYQHLGLQTATWSEGDFNGDGDVDVAEFDFRTGRNVGDLTVLKQHLGLNVRPPGNRIGKLGGLVGGSSENGVGASPEKKRLGTKINDFGVGEEIATPDKRLVVDKVSTPTNRITTNGITTNRITTNLKSEPQPLNRSKRPQRLRSEMPMANDSVKALAGSIDRVFESHDPVEMEYGLVKQPIENQHENVTLQFSESKLIFEPFRR